MNALPSRPGRVRANGCLFGGTPKFTDASATAIGLLRQMDIHPLILGRTDDVPQLLKQDQRTSTTNDREVRDAT
jgi:hypothetical protein